MANSNLSLAIVVKLLTENFQKSATSLKSQLRSMQRNFMAFASVVGAGSVSLANFASRMVSVAKETSRASIALKNVSGSMAAFSENQKWLLGIAQKYGVEINSLTSGFAKFKAAADISSMSLDDQRKIFESVSRASVAFGLSADDQRGIFMALSQMMSKNKVVAEELRLQMAERMPVAIQAMAKAAGVTVNELDALMKQGKVMSSEVLPRFAEELNKMIPNVDLDNLNKSLVDLSNTFQQFTQKMGIEDAFKRLVEVATSALNFLSEKSGLVGEGIKLALFGGLSRMATTAFKSVVADYDKTINAAVKKVEASSRAVKCTQKAEAAYHLAVAEHNKALSEQQMLTTTASAEERRRIEERVSNAIKRIKETETNYFNAKEKEKVASANASADQLHLAAQKGATGWSRAANIATHAFGKLWASLKSFAMANIWTAVLTGLTWMGQKIWENVRAAKRLREEMESLGKPMVTDEMRQLDDLTKLLNNKDESVRKGAIDQINKLLGLQLTREEDITKAVEERKKILEAEAQLANAIEKRDLRLKEYNEEAGKTKVVKYVDKNGQEVASSGYRLTEAKKNLDTAQEWVDKLYEKVSKLKGTAALTDTSYTPIGGGIPREELPMGDDKYLDELPLTDPDGEIKKAVKDGLVEGMLELGGKGLANVGTFQAAEVISSKRDTSGDWKLPDLEILEADKLFAQEKVTKLMSIAEETGAQLGEEIHNAMANAFSLDEALKLGELKQASEEVSKELANLKLDMFEDTIDNVEGVANAFSHLTEAMEENGSTWEKISAVFGMFKAATELIIGTINTITAIQEASAQQQKINAASNIATAQGESIANATKEGSKLPFPANIAAIAAAVGAVMSVFAMIPKFANGGIVGGSSQHGDRVLARLNSGEGVLTPEGLESLHDAADPRNRRMVRVVGVLTGRGRDLKAVIDTENKHITRTR